ncbi:MAG: hypothetical protein Q9191_003100 [Dirinaria sp. TL-2023a]
MAREKKCRTHDVQRLLLLSLEENAARGIPFLCLVLPTIAAALPLNPDSELAQPTEGDRDVASKQIQSLPARRQRRSHEQQGVAGSIHLPRALVSISQSTHHNLANFTIRQSGPFTATVSFDAFIDLNKGKTETPVGIEVRATLLNCRKGLTFLLSKAGGHGR